MSFGIRSSLSSDVTNSISCEPADIAGHDRSALQKRFARIDRKIALVPLAAVALDTVLLQNRHDAVGKVEIVAAGAAAA